MIHNIIIIGASLAGTSAAIELGKNNTNCLILEKKSEIGTPKQCAEGIAKHDIDKIPIKTSKRWLLNNIKGATILSPQNKKIDINFGDKTYYLLERKILEKDLAAEAVKLGAKILLRTNVTNIEREDSLLKITANYEGKEIFFRTKLLIAADGSYSITRQCLFNYKPTKITKTWQYEMANCNIKNKFYFFFGNKNAPGGYIWIFPKTKLLANIGIGVTNTKESPKYFLDKFIKQHPEIFKNSSPIEVNSGFLSAKTLRNLTADNVMLTGDAANLANPLHGKGIDSALLSGKFAAQQAVQAIQNNDFTKKQFKEYEKLIKQHKTNYFKKINHLQRFIYSLEDKDAEKLFSTFTQDELNNLYQLGSRKALAIVSKKLPSIANLAIKNFVKGKLIKLTKLSKKQ